MVQPIIPAQVVLERNAQLDLTPFMQKLYYQVVVVEVETSP